MKRWCMGIMALLLLMGGCSQKQDNVLVWEKEDNRWVSHVKTNTYSMDATIPAMSAKIDKLSKAQAEAQARQFIMAMKQRLLELEKRNVPTVGLGAWLLQGEDSYYGETLASLALIQYDYLPDNAHGAYDIRTYLFNLKTGKQLALTDLFRPEISPYDILSPLAYWMLLDSGQLGKMYDPYWVSQGTAPIFDNFSAFMVDPEGLLLIFAPYQIGPWALGEQRLLIPWERLMPYLNPEYFPK